MEREIVLNQRIVLKFKDLTKQSLLECRSTGNSRPRGESSSVKMPKIPEKYSKSLFKKKRFNPRGRSSSEGLSLLNYTLQETSAGYLYSGESLKKKPRVKHLSTDVNKSTFSIPPANDYSGELSSGPRKHFTRLPALEEPARPAHNFFFLRATSTADDCFRNMGADVKKLFRQLEKVRASFGSSKQQVEHEEEDLGIMSGSFASIEKMISNLREVKAYIDQYSEDKSMHVAVQCDTKPPSEISFSNMNSHNLIKEVAKNMLVKNERISSTFHGNGEQIEAAGRNFPRLDQQSNHILAGVFSAYQEQMVLEEVFSMLKFQGVDMEAKFSEAYMSLGIAGPRTEDRESDSGLLEDAPYSEASITNPAAEKDAAVHKMALTYSLNFNSLELSEDAA